jgi:type I restriction enzyme R subunit
MPLIQEIQTHEWWQDVTLPMLERVRRRLRSLVAFIEKRARKPIYTDFVDEMGEERPHILPEFGRPADLERFRMKARSFLRSHADRTPVRKLRMNEPLAGSDLAELEQILEESGGSPHEIRLAKASSSDLGLFVRSLVGLDREAATRALSGFTSAQPLSANQIEFVKLIVDHLVEHGFVETAKLYESPFTDISPPGPDGLFSEAQLTTLLQVLEHVRSAAIAA